ATRTLARVASAMPEAPMEALNTAPTTKNSDRPILTAVSPPSTPWVGRRYSRNTAGTTNTATVLSWRNTYAAAPSCTAPEISCMVGVPLSAPSTALTSPNAKASATRAITTATTMYVTFVPVRERPSAASVLPDILVPPDDNRSA